MGFEAFFCAVTGHRPYVWQAELAAQLADGIVPAHIVVPTGLGKSSVMICWVWALAQDLRRVHTSASERRRVPVRFTVVVDRRQVVDSTSVLAGRLVAALNDPAAEGPVVEVARALQLATGGQGPVLRSLVLRGGLPSRPEGPRDPVTPTITVGTIDLVGSRMLWRGYGVTPGRRPIDAALYGNDTLLLVDEAHLASQLLTTLDTITQDGRERSPLPGLRVVRATATPPEPSAGFDWAAEVARDPGVGVRRARRRGVPVRLVDAPASGAVNGVWLSEQVLDVAQDVAERGECVTVFVNSARLARDVSGKLADARQKAARPRSATRWPVPGRHLVMVGGMPGLFREELTGLLAPFMSGAAGRGEAPSQLLVATQCLEVGADLDSSRVVSQVASVTSMMQRLGRLNRIGARDVGELVLIATGQDPVYGVEAAALTALIWKERPATVGELEDLLGSARAREVVAAADPVAVLPKTIFDAYLRTSGSRNDAPVERWLRPPQPELGEVQVAFRESLLQVQDETALLDHVAAWPPQPDEVWTVPASLARDLLASALKQQQPVVVFDPERQVAPRLVRRVEDVASVAVLVFPPVDDVFTIPGAGADLASAAGQFLLRPTPSLGIGGAAAADDVVADVDDGSVGLPQGWTCRELYDVDGDSVGWQECWPVRAEDRWQDPWRYPLDDHQRDVAERVHTWAVALGLPAEVVDDLTLAAAHHDDGKTAPIAQALYALSATSDGRLQHRPAQEALGKSDIPWRLRSLARGRAGMAPGWRHEAVSAALFDQWLAQHPGQCHDPGLVRHLILSHHGHYRGLGPVLDPDAPDRSPYQDPHAPQWAATSTAFAGLVDGYGPYTLALYEAIVRLADWHESGAIR